MKPLDESEFQTYLQKADISIPEQQLQKKIGRELTFRQSSKRTIVVHFTKEDFPQTISAVLDIILSLHNEWIFLPCFGYLSNWIEFNVRQESIAMTFEESERRSLCDLVTGHFDKMRQTNDDIYIFAARPGIPSLASIIIYLTMV